MAQRGAYFSDRIFFIRTIPPRGLFATILALVKRYELVTEEPCALSRKKFCEMRRFKPVVADNHGRATKCPGD